MVLSVKRPLFYAAVCWLFLFVLAVVAYGVPVARWADGWAVEGFLNMQRPWLTDVAHHVARLADPGPYAVLTVIVAGAALYRRRPRHALAVIVLVGGANVIAQVLKVVLAHPRHHDFLGDAQLAAAAFPSGHATASMTLAFAAVLVAPAAWRRVVALLGALFTVAVSESILLLAWHFPSDVIGGFVVAMASTFTMIAALRAADSRWPERSGRAAARRAIAGAGPRQATAAIAGLVLATLLVGVAAAGDRTVSYAGRHTTAVVAAAAVAILAAALPVTVAAVGNRRS